MRDAVIGLICLCLWSGGVLAEPYKADAGPHEVVTALGTWVDESRGDREVPWKLYRPVSIESPVPVVIWSHGGGGSREGAQYLGEHLASHGYATFHIQHPGTDASLIRGDGREGLLKRLQNPRAIFARFADVPFAVEQIHQMNEQGALAGLLDVERMGISGHSLGATTTLVAAGQTTAAIGDRFAVPELEGAFAMSPSARGEAPEAMFDDMHMPIFHLTGTRDESPLGDFEPVDRQVPFQVIDDVPQYLLVMNGATHMTFSGRPDARDPHLDRHHELIRMCAVAFWDLLLKDDADAGLWLNRGGLEAELAGDGEFRAKTAAVPAQRSGAEPPLWGDGRGQ